MVLLSAKYLSPVELMEVIDLVDRDNSDSSEEEGDITIEEEIVTTKFNINIMTSHIEALVGDNWLHGEIINFYMNLLVERSNLRRSEGLPLVYAMNTDFMTRLLQIGYCGVKRWTRKVNIFEKDIILVPVHVANIHWCIAIIDFRNRSIIYYDSLKNLNLPVLKALEQYLKDESLDKHRITFDTSTFKIEHAKKIPLQKNGHDCGVFTCMFAEYITRNQVIKFTQGHIAKFREQMFMEILIGETRH